MTFSIAARCVETGMLGVAVCSSSPATAARCGQLRAGVGVASIQNIGDPALGDRALDLLALGADAGQVMAILRASSRHIEFRQVVVLDARGGSAIYSGRRTNGVQGEAWAENVACAGNLLADPGVPQAMVDAFRASSGHLGHRLVGALQAARAAGGEAGPVHSAGLKLVRDTSWPIADLRVDWTEDCPVAGLAALWDIYEPQLEAYVTRARDPASAPSFGVPGDP